MGWVTRRLSACALFVLVTAPSLSAQTCAPPPNPYFEFQAERRAVFLPDSSISPRPSARRAPGLGTRQRSSSSSSTP